MSLEITLEPEYEARFTEEARRMGLPVEQLVVQRAIEAELLWKIRLAAPESETRTLHRLLRKRDTKIISEFEREQLQTLLDAREQLNAQRLEDLVKLARLRGIDVSSLMDQLGIRPIPAT